MAHFLDSTSVIDDPSELRQRMRRDGFLFLRGLLPTDKLSELRFSFLAIAHNHGWVKKNALIDEAIADQNGFCVEPTPEYMDVYRHMYALCLLSS